MDIAIPQDWAKPSKDAEECRKARIAEFRAQFFIPVVLGAVEEE